MRAWSQESEEIIQSLKVQSCQHLHCNPKFFFFFLHFETQAVRFVNFTSSSSFFFFLSIQKFIDYNTREQRVRTAEERLSAYKFKCY